MDFRSGPEGDGSRDSFGVPRRNLSGLFAEDPERFYAIMAVVLWTNMESTVRLLSDCVQ